MAKISGIDITSLLFQEGAAPSTPASTKWRLYFKTDGIYVIDDAGAETGPLGTGSGGTDKGEELAYTEFTSNVSPTATTEGAANTVVTASAVVFDGSTKCNIEFFTPICRANNGAGDRMTFVLYDGASSIGLLGGIGQGSTSGNEYKTVKLSRIITPSAASHTYSIRAYVSTGTGVIGAGAGGSGANVPGYIRITRA